MGFWCAWITDLYSMAALAAAPRLAPTAAKGHSGYFAKMLWLGPEEHSGLRFAAF
jgi:hypothetical protein